MESAGHIVLYTNRNCPWAHRAHIALAELGLACDEEHVDYSKPRSPEYLKINRRGQVPTLLYGSHVISESAIIAQFLADSVQETHLTPHSGHPEGALKRAQMAFFVETYFSRANSFYYPAIAAKTAEDADELGTQFVNAVSADVEPLLQDAKPFFGGSSTLTMAEVLTASFIIRIFTLPFVEDAPLPKTMVQGLDEKAPAFFAWANAIIAHPSVNGIYNRDGCAAEMRARRAKARGLV